MTKEQIEQAGQRHADEKAGTLDPRPEICNADSWHLIYDSFLAGASFASPAVSGQGMKWVRLSERSWTKLDDDLIVRTISEKIRINLDNVKWHKTNVLHCDFDGAHGWYIKDIPYSNIEWLDESPSTPSGEAEELAKALEQIVFLFSEYHEAKSIATKALAKYKYPTLTNQIKTIEFSDEDESIPPVQEEVQGVEAVEWEDIFGEYAFDWMNYAPPSKSEIIIELVSKYKLTRK